MIKKELLEGLSEEQLQKLSGCKSFKEVLTLVKEEGIELNETQLEAFSGGVSDNEWVCPECGNPDTELHYVRSGFFHACPKCGKVF